MPIRILIADDNDLVRRALRLALQSRGRWEVVEAKDGEDAVRKAKEVRPNLIILDLAMPVMDGIRAARSITMQMPEIPIIMHTLHWSPRVKAEALKSGVRRVVAKSDSATILGAVEELLRPELKGYVATIAEPEALPADITVVRPASESEVRGDAEPENPGDLVAHDANGSIDR
jgi:DNA-binding NarL/FixJ family response regulator